MYIKRSAYRKIFEHHKRKEFTIITGARQTGKTTILKQLFTELKSENKDVWFISFEKYTILSKINKDPENLFSYTSRPKNPLLDKIHETIYVLIDEIQYANEPSNFLKYLFDTYSPNLKIIATGSSAFYIDNKFKDSLAGRKRIFKISTLNFEEFLYFKDEINLINELKLLRNRNEYLSARLNEILQLFNEYIIHGGYPAVVLSENIKEKIYMLDEIKNSFIKKDIVDSRVENETKFYELMIILASQTGNLLNVNELSKILRINNETVEKYIYVLKKSFHIDLIKPFYSNIKKEIIKMPKLYFNDLGLRNSLINNFSDIKIRTDKGELFENYIYIRLKEIYKKENIKFWRTANQNEVDFVTTQKKSIAYEVKINPSKIKLSKYKSFVNSYPEINFNFITYYQDEKQKSIYFLKF